MDRLFKETLLNVCPTLILCCFVLCQQSKNHRLLRKPFYIHVLCVSYLLFMLFVHCIIDNNLKAIVTIIFRSAE